MSTEPLKNGHSDPLAPFQVEKALPGDLKEISEFLFGDFLASEPLNASLELRREECEQFITDLVAASLHDGLSYVVRDPAKEKRLVGVRMTCLLRRNGSQSNDGQAENGGQDSAFGKERPENGKVRKICALIHAVESRIWQLVPAGLNCLAYWLVLSVSGEYKRRGIAAALLQYRLEELEAYGCQGAITEASALNSQKLFQKLGYVRLFELPHGEWKDPKSGERVFSCKDGTDRITLEFKAFGSGGRVNGDGKGEEEKAD